MKAIYHLVLETLSRSKGRNFVQVAAYLTGEVLNHFENGRRFSRRSSEDVRAWEIVGTNLSLEEISNRTEMAENRKNATVGRHIVVALPLGMTNIQMLDLLREFATYMNEVALVPVVFALHVNSEDLARSRNPHGHLLFGGRPWNEHTQSFADRRFAALYERYGDGPKIIENMRLKWEQLVNANLPVLTPPVSRLSHARRGISRPARRHLGAYATAQERRTGKLTRDGEFNSMIDDLEAHDGALNELQMEIGALESALGTTDESLTPITASESRAVAQKQIHEADLVAEAESVLARPKARHRNAGLSKKPAAQVTQQARAGLEEIDVMAPWPKPVPTTIKSTFTPAEALEIHALVAKHRRRHRSDFQSLSDYYESYRAGINRPAPH